MTTQVPDTLQLEGRTYVILNWQGDTDCIPSSESLGFHTVSQSSENWSGRIDHYGVWGNELYLFKIAATLGPLPIHQIHRAPGEKSYFATSSFSISKVIPLSCVSIATTSSSMKTLSCRSPVGSSRWRKKTSGASPRPHLMQSQQPPSPSSFAMAW